MILLSASIGPRNRLLSRTRTAAGLTLQGSAPISSRPRIASNAMFIVDRALERLQKSGTPIRVGMVGAGFMARGIARQMLHYTNGMELVAISNRHLDGARRVYSESGENDVTHVRSPDELDG